MLQLNIFSSNKKKPPIKPISCRLQIIQAKNRKQSQLKTSSGERGEFWQLSSVPHCHFRVTAVEIKTFIYWSLHITSQFDELVSGRSILIYCVNCFLCKCLVFNFLSILFLQTYCINCFLCKCLVQAIQINIIIKIHLQRKC